MGNHHADLLFEQLRAMDLPPGSYAVFGSGPLAIRYRHMAQQPNRPMVSSGNRNSIVIMFISYSNILWMYHSKRLNTCFAASSSSRLST